MKKYSITGFVLVFATLTALFVFKACSHNHPDDLHAHAGSGSGAAGHQELESATMVSLTDEQMNAIGLKLGAVEQKNLTSTLKANGYLRVPNQNKAKATSLYGGVVKTLLVRPGSIVKAGQTATIANPEIITMQEEYLTLAERIALAELEYKRQQELNEGNAGALKNLQQANLALSTLQTRRASLHQQLQLMGIATDKLSNDKLISMLAVRSPLGGTVSNVMVQIGSYVDANTPVADIVDNSQLHLDLFVYEQDLLRLRNNQTIHFTLTNNPGKEYDAVIYSIGNAFEEDTKTIPIHAQVKGNKIGLIEGMSITAVVSLSTATVPAVPTAAIVTHERQDFIFIQTSPNNEKGHKDEVPLNHAAGADHEHGEEEPIVHDHDTGELVFEKIPIRRGPTDIGYAEITPLTALPPNAKVVVNGAFFLLAKMTNRGEGHAH